MKKHQKVCVFVKSKGEASNVKKFLLELAINVINL